MLCPLPPLYVIYLELGYLGGGPSRNEFTFNQSRPYPCV